MSWLVISIVVSLVATVALNIVARLGSRRRLAQRPYVESPIRRADGRIEAPPRRFTLFFPWKALLLASVALTIVVNLVRW